MPKNISKTQICKYAILTCLSETDKLNFEQISRNIEYEDRVIVSALGNLLTWRDIKKSIGVDKKTEYQITNTGKKKQKHFKNVKNYDKLWKPSWD